MAGLLYTNNSSTPCTLSGYPFAQLHYRGKPLGKPAKNNPGQVHTVVVRPGRSAQAQLTAITTCQAPISDQVVEVAPGTNEARSVPMQLRGCSLSVDPIEPG